MVDSAEGESVPSKGLSAENNRVNITSHGMSRKREAEYGGQIKSRASP
jgi:hypothetical protein